MKNLIRLMCLSVILLTTYATAEITIDGETIHVETDNYNVHVRYGVVTHLHNKLTDEVYSLPLEPEFETNPAILGTNENFWSPHAHTVETHKINQNTAEAVWRRGENQIRLVVAIDPHTDDLILSGDCTADTPGVHSIQLWGIDNLNIEKLRLIVPSEKVQLIDANFKRDDRDFYYPSTSWEAQLAIIEAQHGGFYVRSKDTTFQFKGMFYKRYTDKCALRFRTENQAPWDNLTTATSVTWRFNTYKGDWRVPAQIYRDWMEKTFDPWKLADMPPWVQDIKLILVNDRMEKEVLAPLAELIDPTKTLIHLTSWHKVGRNSDFRGETNPPDYLPHEKFEGFLEEAHRYGFRVMLYVSLYDCSESHPLYSKFKKYQYRHPETNELLFWVWDDIGASDYAHISLASSEWRNLLVQEFKAIWEKYNIDAFYLDVSHFVLNDANGLIEGLTSAEGNVLMHEQLAEAMPGVVFGGEGVHEVNFSRESFAKQGGFTKGPLHPISALLFSPYTRFHSGGGLPGTRDPHYHIYLDTAESQGYLPTLWINKTEMLEIPLLQQVLSVARQWQELGLRPDAGCDWGPNTLFQYTTQTGETVTHQRTDSGSVLVLPNDGGYERVLGATQAQTHRSLRHWRAYNDTTLLGLDPNRAYFLDIRCTHR